MENANKHGPIIKRMLTRTY